MRKFYSMLMLAAVLPVFAAKTSNITVSTEKVDMSHREYVKQNHILPQKSLAPADGEEEVILTPPADADYKMYTRKTLGYSVRWGQAYTEKDEGIVGEIAFCDNGDVYVKNPISFYITDTWMKGKKEGNKLTFTFPQLIALLPADEGVEDGEYMELWLNVIKSVFDKTSVSFEYDKNLTNEITMTLDEDGNVIYQEELATALIGGEEFSYPKQMLALTDASFNWLGYGDYDCLYAPFDMKPTRIPETIESQEYAMTYGDNGKWVNVAFDEDANKMYIAGIYSPDDKGFEDLANNAIIGDLLDGGVMFKSRQYVGIDPYYYHAFLSGGTVVDGQYLDIDDVYLMTCDSKRSKFTSGSVLAVSEGENQGYVLDTFYYPVFDNQGGYVDPNPAQPTVTAFMPWTPDYGYGGIRVQIPNTNKNGQLLHEENLSYSIIINDNQVIFDPEEYPEFSEPTAWIPFDFTSYNVEIYPYAFNTRMVFMYDVLAEDVYTMSVQSRYKDKDTYYVTNGPIYTYKTPKLEAPTFSPESGYEFIDQTGEVTITSPGGTLISYKVFSEEGGSQNYIDSDSNVVKVKFDKSCFIQAFTKDPDVEEDAWSDIVTATYTVTETSVATIVEEMGGDVEIFTVDGLPVKKDILEPGLYIIVKSGKAERVLVK